MNSLQLLPALEVGGVERGVVDLAKAMKRCGEGMVVVSSGGALVGTLHKLGIPHYTLPVHKKSVFSLAMVDKIVRIIERERVDIVHARSRVPAWLGWLAARKAHVPFVTTCHGYYSAHGFSRVMGWGKRVIVISRTIGRHMIDDFGVEPDCVRLIHRGIDLEQFPYAAGKYLHRPKMLKVIQVGRFSPIKGQVEFLKALHRVRSEIPQVEAWLVGAEEKGKQKYTALIHRTIEQLGLSSCVKLLGIRRDIASLLTEADLLVLPTLTPEAFGRVIVEAGAVGTAVVATRVGGVLDIIDEGQNGLLVPPGNIEAMAEAMTSMLADRPKAGEMAAALRDKVTREFTLEQMVEKTRQVYREVLNDRKILVIKLGAMGDLILTTPSLRMLREKFPTARISVAVDKNLASLVSRCPYVDEIIPVKRKQLTRPLYLLKLAKQLRRDHYDIAVDLQNSKWTHLLAYLAGIPLRYGFRRGHLGFLLNRPEIYFRLPESPVRNQFRILSKLGIKDFDERLELWSDPASQRQVQELFRECGADLTAKRIALVIGSSPSWPSKRWPVSHFRDLIRELGREAGVHIFLIGTREEEDLARELMGESSGNVFNWVGKTTPQDLVSLMPWMDVAVTGDTAPLHVAAAMGVKIVALFGPTDPKRHMPPGEGALALSRHLPCQPCYRGTCSHEVPFSCMRKIPVDEVLEVIRRHLAHPRTGQVRAAGVSKP